MPCSPYKVETRLAECLFMASRRQGRLVLTIFPPPSDPPQQQPDNHVQGLPAANASPCCHATPSVDQEVRRCHGALTRRPNNNQNNEGQRIWSRLCRGRSILRFWEVEPHSPAMATFGAKSSSFVYLSSRDVNRATTSWSRPSAAHTTPKKSHTAGRGSPCLRHKPDGAPTAC